MSKSIEILWATDELAQVIPITRAFEPVRVWSEAERGFTDEQQTDENGIPVWESEALLKTGWGASLTPVRVRMVSRTKPAAQPDPMKLARMLGMGVASADTRREAQNHG